MKKALKKIFKCKHRNAEIQSMTCYSFADIKEITVQYKCSCGHEFTKNTREYIKSLVIRMSKC